VETAQINGQELQTGLKKTLLSYLEVARHELNELLGSYGKKTFYSSLMILAGTLGLAWLSVSLGFYLSRFWSWELSSVVIGGAFILISATAWSLTWYTAHKANKEIKEIGNEILSERINLNQAELEKSLVALTKELLHQASPEVVIEKAVSKNPSAAILGSVIAGAVFGYANTRKSAHP